MGTLFIILADKVVRKEAIYRCRRDPSMNLLWLVMIPLAHGQVTDVQRRLPVRHTDTERTGELRYLFPKQTGRQPVQRYRNQPKNARIAGIPDQYSNHLSCCNGVRIPSWQAGCRYGKHMQAKTFVTDAHTFRIKADVL